MQNEDKDGGHGGEIIIVKRGGGDHDEHHGGVWKIAFADFMTALMAFFLVMWLINASNEQTRKAVASYFNPIKLMDTTSNPKGVKNPKYGVEQQNIEEEEESTKVTNPVRKMVSTEAPNKTFEEQALFVDPFALLSEIEGGIERDADTPRPDGSTEQNKRGMALNGGVSFQDPFDPSVWNVREGNTERNMEEGEEEDIASELRASANGSQEGDQEADGAGSTGTGIGQLAVDESDKEFEMVGKPKTDDLRDLVVDEENPEGPITINRQGEGSEQEISEASKELAEALEEKIAALKDETEVNGLDVDVQLGQGGASVVLSDKSQNGMFDIGSARPTTELVKIMKKIGDVIAGHNGTVEISGHTDGRKYQSGDYDNWRLSTARAHMAYYMLVRGGMREEQVEKIVGQADVRLKVPDDPYSASNRRIEVLLKVQ